jgi:aspartate racemase
MQAIYGKDGIKSGHKTHPRKILTEVANELTARGAQAIITACTEISIVMGSEDVSFEVIDPLAIIAHAATRRASGTDRL